MALLPFKNTSLSRGALSQKYSTVSEEVFEKVALIRELHSMGASMSNESYLIAPSTESLTTELWMQSSEVGWK